MSSPTSLPGPAPAGRQSHGSGSRLAHVVGHRWPTLLALALVALTVGDGESPPVDALAVLTLVLPTACLAFGAARNELRPRGVLLLQLGAFAFYLVLAAVALSVGEDLARWLVGLGWIAHAVWDLVHHRAGRVVPRQWAEWCGVVDLGLGVAILTL